MPRRNQIETKLKGSSLKLNFSKLISKSISNVKMIVAYLAGSVWKVKTNCFNTSTQSKWSLTI